MKKKLFIRFYTDSNIPGCVYDNYDTLLRSALFVYRDILEIEFDTDQLRPITLDEKNVSIRISHEDKISRLKKELEELELDEVYWSAAAQGWVLVCVRLASNMRDYVARGDK